MGKHPIFFSFQRTHDVVKQGGRIKIELSPRTATIYTSIDIEYNIRDK